MGTPAPALAMAAPPAPRLAAGFAPRLAAAAASLAAAPAAAEVRACVSFRAETLPDAANFEKLLRNEVARHRSHAVVDSDDGCDTHLDFEYVEAGGAGYVTGRIDYQVPQRVAVPARGDLVAKMGELATILLDNDPVSLSRNVERKAALQRASYALRRRGHNLYGGEAFGMVVRTGAAPASLSGFAVRFRREADQWAIGARASLALRLGDATGVPAGPEPRRAAGLDFEVAHYFSRAGAWSPYLGGGGFWQALSVDVPFSAEDVVSRESALASAFGAQIRAGVEFLRWTDMRVDLFAAATLPLLPQRDAERELLDAWMPALQIGVGVAF